MTSYIAPDILPLSNRIAHGNLVAGAAAEGHGALTDWLGRGARTGAALLQLTRGIIPEAWLPAPKDAPVQLGRAMHTVAGNRYVVRPVRKSKDPKVRETETWLARYILVTMPVANQVRAGDKFGDIVMVATLVGDETVSNLQCEVPQTDDPALFSERQQLCAQLRLTYGSLVGAQVHTASDITRWLGLTLRRQLQCIRYGRAYYIPRETRETAEALVNALRSDGWGHNWMYPALPVATSGQMSLGLALGLALDVTELANELGAMRTEAREAGRPDIGPRALQTKREQLDVIKARVNFYADRLGEARSEVDEPIRDLEATLYEIEQGHLARAEAAA